MATPIRRPHRIAWVEQDVTMGEADAALERTAELLLFAVAFEMTVRHPDIAVVDPDDMHVRVLDGQFVAMHGLRVQSMEADAFGSERRDELLWFEVSLAPGARAIVRLQTKDAAGKTESFDAVGGDLGGSMGRCMAAWLSARGLDALPRPAPAFTREELRDVAQAIAPALAAAAATTPGLRTTDEPAPEPTPDEVVDVGGAGPDAIALESDEEDADEEDEDGEPVRAATPAAVPPAPQARRFADLGIVLPDALRVPALRTLALTVGIDVHEEILALDPENPWALRDLFFATLARGRDFPLLRRCIAAAPAWGKPYLSLYLPSGEDRDDDPKLAEPDEDEELAAFAWSSVCMPNNEFATGGYARRLDAADRDGEAVRWHHRSVAADPDDASAHTRYLASVRELDRMGRYLTEAEISSRRFENATLFATIFGNPDVLKLDLECSVAYLNVGRINEGIALRDNRLAGLESSWRNNVDVTKRWKTSPALLAQSYAREGYYRGDDGRVLEGFGRGAPGDGLDLAMFIESLVAADRAEEACFAYADLGLGRRLRRPVARVAAARALLLSGEARRALHELALVALRYPRHGLAVSTCHVLRLLPSVPLDALVSVVSDFTAAGAHRLARIVARDIADFAPGAGASAPIAKALGKQTALPLTVPAGFDDVPSRAAIDALFGHADVASASADLARFDALVDGWAPAVYSATRAEEPVGLARATAYVLARALASYFAACASASVMAGAYRTVAHEAVQALAWVRDSLPLADVRAVLSLLDGAARETAYGDIVTSWLVRLEDVLLLDERTHGRLGEITNGSSGELVEVAQRMTSPERVAVIEHELARLRRDRPEGWAEDALPLYDAHFWASGGDLAGEWTDAAKAALPPDQALDIHTLCAFVTAGWNAGASVNAAEVYLERGEGRQALDALCNGLGPAGSDWRDEQLARLKPLWKKAKVEVPFDFAKAAGKVFEALQGGKPDDAILPGRWICAYDSKNKEAWRNLGLAYASSGRVLEAIEALMRADPTQGMQICAGVLVQAGRTEEAMKVCDYASRWFTRADEWLTFGGIAYRVADNPRTVKGYENAYQLDADALDVSMLNAFAGVLDEIGDYKRCEQIALRQQSLVGDDLMWQTCAWYNLACAYLGQGRHAEALPLAKKAVAKNPLPDNAATFAVALERAQSKAPVVPPAPLVAPTADEDLRSRWLDGDMREVLEAAQSADAKPQLLLRAVRASRFRYDSENRVTSTPRMRETAANVLARTASAPDAAASLARSFALDLRAEASFPLDPLPPLGDRMTRAEFYDAFRARGGTVLGDAAQAPRELNDREVVAGSKAPKISDYARLLHALARQPPLEALSAHDLDLASYRELASAWADALRLDPAVSADLETALGSSFD